MAFDGIVVYDPDWAGKIEAIRENLTIYGWQKGDWGGGRKPRCLGTAFLLAHGVTRSSELKDAQPFVVFILDTATEITGRPFVSLPGFNDATIGLGGFNTTEATVYAVLDRCLDKLERYRETGYYGEPPPAPPFEPAEHGESTYAALLAKYIKPIELVAAAGLCAALAAIWRALGIPS